VLYDLAAAVGHSRAVAFCLPGVLLAQFVVQPLLLALLVDAVGTAWRQLASPQSSEDTEAVMRWVKALLRRVRGLLSGVFWRSRADYEVATPFVGAAQKDSDTVAVWRKRLLQRTRSPVVGLALAAAYVANLAAMCVVPPTLGALAINIFATGVFCLYTAARAASLGLSAVYRSWAEVADTAVTLAAVVRSGSHCPFLCGLRNRSLSCVNWFVVHPDPFYCVVVPKPHSWR
jgi:hypothetical protein